ncbi:MAG: hypothetical protein KDJ24_08350 [Gammaproteobacteria bacterium]|nr:hypothetical protein [Gammaproteobacteria bacterium]
MDLLDFDADDLYFDTEQDPVVTELLSGAAEAYGTPAAEQRLLRAYFHAPESLSVLVGLYRYYYYQHRYDDALDVADRALLVTRQRLGFTADTLTLSPAEVAAVGERSMTLFRFHLYALKGSAYLLMRLGRNAEALQRLGLIAAIDHVDRMGVSALIELARSKQRDDPAYAALA